MRCRRARRWRKPMPPTGGRGGVIRTLPCDHSSMTALYQRKIRAHLQSIEYNFRVRSRDVEVANDEVRRKLGEYALDTGSQIEERWVLVADIAAQNDERLWVSKKRSPCSVRQYHGRQRIWAAVCGGGPQGKGRADVCV